MRTVPPDYGSKIFGAPGWYEERRQNNDQQPGYVGGNQVPHVNEQGDMPTVELKARTFSLGPGMAILVGSQSFSRKYFYASADISNTLPVYLYFGELSGSGNFSLPPDVFKMNPGFWYEPWKIPFNALSFINPDVSNIVTFSCVLG